jgi:hypothetical protein
MFSHKIEIIGSNLVDIGYTNLELFPCLVKLKSIEIFLNSVACSSRPVYLITFWTVEWIIYRG